MLDSADVYQRKRVGYEQVKRVPLIGGDHHRGLSGTPLSGDKLAVTNNEEWD